MAQSGSAQRSGRWGRRFKSCPLDQIRVFPCAFRVESVTAPAPRERLDGHVRRAKLPWARGHTRAIFVLPFNHTRGLTVIPLPTLCGGDRNDGRGGHNNQEEAVAVVAMKQLLEAGVHFGHQTRRWNPKMQRYIFTERNGIHIIDLQKTVMGLEEAYGYARELASAGEKMLFVGTKKQAQEAVRDEAQRAGQFYVNQRWLGGLLTNFKTIQERLRRLDELERLKMTGEMDLRPKKEQLKLGDEMAKLNRLLGGIRTMRRLPAALFIVDCQKEHLAVHEASRLEIPIVALVDTNADPDPVAYPIPANDDAIRAVRLLAGKIADATLEGQQMREAIMAEQREEEGDAVVAEDATAAGGPPLPLDTGEAVDLNLPVEEQESTEADLEGITEPTSTPDVRPAAIAESQIEEGSTSSGGEGIEVEDELTAESGASDSVLGTEIGQEDSVPEPIMAEDLAETDSVLPMAAVDGLEPLPDIEGDQAAANEELAEAAEVEEGSTLRVSEE